MPNRTKGLIIAIVVAIGAGGGALWLAVGPGSDSSDQAGDQAGSESGDHSGDRAGRGSGDTTKADPWTDAEAALKATPKIFEAADSYDYRTLARNIAAAERVMTPKAKAEYAPRRGQLIQIAPKERLVHKVRVVRAGVMEAEPGRVKILVAAAKIRDGEASREGPYVPTFWVDLVRVGQTWKYDASGMKFTGDPPSGKASWTGGEGAAL